jgi:hypothetical protein
LFIIISDEKELSTKTKYVQQLLKQNPDIRFLHIFRTEEEKLTEKWQTGRIQLATSPKGFVMHLILMMLKPKDLHDEIIRRFLRRNFPSFGKRNFLLVLSQALSQYLAKSARSNGVIRFLKQLEAPKTFIIDEFFSLRVINLSALRKLGPIVYVSSDLGYDFFGDNCAASKLMYKMERDAISLMDVVIACSERDRLKYVEMGAREVVFYPNIYPITELELHPKDQEPSISIVLRGYWGSRADKALQEVFNALSLMDIKVKVYLIGIEPQKIPREIDLQYYNHIPNRIDFLQILSRSWIGINLGIHMGGTNQRKYDYALAGLVVFSDNFGSRGDLVTYEYTYVDSHDLAAKLQQLLRLGKAKIEQMGAENRKHATTLADNQREQLTRLFKCIA